MQIFNFPQHQNCSIHEKYICLRIQDQVFWRYLADQAIYLILLVSSWNINCFTSIKENPVWRKKYFLCKTVNNICFLLLFHTLQVFSYRGNYLWVIGRLYLVKTWPWNISQVFLTLCQEVCCSVQIYFAVRSPLTKTLLGPIKKTMGNIKVWFLVFSKTVLARSAFMTLDLHKMGATRNIMASTNHDLNTFLISFSSITYQNKHKNGW